MSRILRAKQKYQFDEWYGPYRYAGPVSETAKYSIYHWIECPSCGHRVSMTTSRCCSAKKKTKTCGGCGATREMNESEYARRALPCAS